MTRLRRDFEYNLRLLDARDGELAAAEAAAEAAARDNTTMRDDAARTHAAMEAAHQGAHAAFLRSCGHLHSGKWECVSW